METIMVTAGLGFTGRHITKRLAVGGHCVVSYNRDFAPCSHRTDRRRATFPTPVSRSARVDRKIACNLIDEPDLQLQDCRPWRYPRA